MSGKEQSFSRFAWILARCLRRLGEVWAGWIKKSVPTTVSVQHVVDRVTHLNQALGYLVPALTYVLSQEASDGVHFVFRPFTDDADRISETYEPIVRRLLSPQLSDV